MYRILNGTTKEVEKELNHMHKHDHERVQVLIMNTYVHNNEPRLIVLVYIGQ